LAASIVLIVGIILKIMNKKQVKTGVLLISKRDSSIWKVNARNYDEIIMTHFDCVLKNPDWNVFTWQEIEERFEIYKKPKTKKVNMFLIKN
jgi:hypothetical protein